MAGYTRAQRAAKAKELEKTAPLRAAISERQTQVNEYKAVMNTEREKNREFFEKDQWDSTDGRTQYDPEAERLAREQELGQVDVPIGNDWLGDMPNPDAIIEAMAELDNPVVTYEWLIPGAGGYVRPIRVETDGGIEGARAYAQSDDIQPPLTQLEASWLYNEPPSIVRSQAVTLAHDEALRENERLTIENLMLGEIKILLVGASVEPTVEGFTDYWFNANKKLKADFDAEVEKLDGVRLSIKQSMYGMIGTIERTMRAHGLVDPEPKVESPDFSAVDTILTKPGATLTEATLAVIGHTPVVQRTDEMTPLAEEGERLANIALDRQMRGGWGNNERAAVQAYRDMLKGRV